MKLTITQRPENGILIGSKSKSFSVCRTDVNYEIAVDQCVVRKITIISSKGEIIESTLGVYHTLESLLILFDGQFYYIDNVIENDLDITTSWKERYLPSYYSDNIMLGTENRLIDFDAILDEHIFQNWYELKEELDLIHKMVLYCLSSVKMPRDMQCAFMAEAFLGICELVHKKCPEFSLPHVPQNKSKLKYYFLAVAHQFGADIFDEEFAASENKYAQMLVDNRNRIAHIKSKQDRTYLDGTESVMYLMKLSLLYRVVLFTLLGITSNLYSDKLISHVQSINNHEGMKKFLKKLGEHND